MGRVSYGTVKDPVGLPGLFCYKNAGADENFRECHSLEVFSVFKLNVQFEIILINLELFESEYY